MLSSKPFDYLQLKVLGSKCFTYVWVYNSQKLKPRATVYVFVGYSGNKKGYICLDRRNDKVMSKIYVMFNEVIFPSLKNNKGLSGSVVIVSTSIMLHGQLPISTTHPVTSEMSSSLPLFELHDRGML